MRKISPLNDFQVIEVTMKTQIYPKQHDQEFQTSGIVLVGLIVGRKRRGKTTTITPQLRQESCQREMDLPLPKLALLSMMGHSVQSRPR